MLLAANPAPVPAEGWEQVESGDVQVWTRSVSGENVREVRATMVMHATPGEIRETLEDEERSRRQPHQVELRLLEHPAPNVWVHYGRLSAPLIDDRDYFVRAESEVNLDANGRGWYRLSWKACCQDRPERRGVVRVTRSEGTWSVQSMGESGDSLVEFHVLCDPGGSVPGWAVNLVNKKAVPELLRNLERDAIRRRETANR